VLIAGQLTMFYYEDQYLDPINAVTLMTRYCAPANMGLLIAMCSFASGGAAGGNRGTVLPGRRRLAAAVLAGAFVFSSGAYAEMGRRFIHDPLDAGRAEKRGQFTQMYGDFLEAINAVPLNEEGSRVLLCVYRMEMNPIVTNEASPVSFMNISLTGDAERDMAAIHDALQEGHGRYFYVESCEESLVEVLSAHTKDGQSFETKALYEIFWNGSLLLKRAE
jgi:hypothetical protein